MKRICLIALLLLPILNKAQLIPPNSRKFVDSLNAIIDKRNKQSDSVKIIAYFALSRYWGKEKDTVKARYFLIQGKKMSKSSHYLYATYLYSMGMNSMYINNKINAKKYLLKADSVFAYGKTKDYYIARAKLWNNYSILLSTENKHNQAIDILLNKVVPLATLSGNLPMVGTAYANVANLLSGLSQNEKASVYFEKSIDVLENIKIDTMVLANAYNNSARNSMVLNRFEETKILLNKARSLLKARTNTSSFVYYCGFESYYWLKLKQFDKSLIVLNKGLEMAKKLNLGLAKNNLLNQKYNILNEQENHDAARDIIMEIIKGDSNTYIEAKTLHYKQAYETYSKLKNLPEAYKWLEKYTLLRDSANNIRLKEEVNKVEIKFRSAENNRQINELKIANEKSRLATKNSYLLNWLLGSISFLTLSLLIFGIYYYRNQKKNISQKAQIQFVQFMLEGQEKERNRIARDLHDGLGNMLTVVKLNLRQFAKENPTLELNEIIDQLGYSINELRRIAHDMMPEMLMTLGLEAALSDLCESLASDDFEVHYQFTGLENTTPQQIQITIYRIVQELLTNVVKHANAKNVLLQCTYNKPIFSINLEDDGKGFDINFLHEKQGIGLNNIRSRIAYLNGKIEVRSKINQPGTLINIELHVRS
ncbi:hypothetical protein BWD42_07130 [Sphingobacterium sp. CZ-UAM]|uniref:histidine kinase n=1 Tax=Sphingobacterium sp. CZ-UAM TaxID=1933868 RepID=UPI0009865D23|nr:histidine kinase [Sphingobacterium sp. CZ-UAM]OOG19675.1 hypothetical protein BWD42_07130 [Sphingobacterium sp. CZ-UAM]